MTIKIEALVGGQTAACDYGNKFVHNSHAEWDGHERAVLESMSWSISPLREADIQWHDDRDASF